MINIQGFNLVTYVQKKEVIITSCYITPYCLYAYKILVLSYISIASPSVIFELPASISSTIFNSRLLMTLNI